MPLRLYKQCCDCNYSIPPHKQLYKCDTQPAKTETSAFNSGELLTVLHAGHAFPYYRASTECETSVPHCFLLLSVPLHDNTDPVPPAS